MTLVRDARDYQTKLTYTLINNQPNLYPTKTEVAFGTSVQRTTTQEYDFHTGLVTKTTDADNNVSTSTQYDAFGRPTLVKAAEGTNLETRDVTVYADAARRVTTRSDLSTTGDAKMVSINHFDQLGRVRLSRQLEIASAADELDETKGIKAETRYFIDRDNHFTYRLSSNPYRAASSTQAASEPTMGWTRTKIERGGRVVEVQSFAGSNLPFPWGANASSTGVVLTSYDAEFTTVMDQANKVRRSMVDALGRPICG